MFEKEIQFYYLTYIKQATPKSSCSFSLISEVLVLSAISVNNPSQNQQHQQMQI
jgi:hypothetical protein